MQPAHDIRREEGPAANPWGLPRARVLSLVSQKGGVAKTTSTVNLGAALALSGHRVLIIGTDPQCGVSRTLGYSPDGKRHAIGRWPLGRPRHGRSCAARCPRA